MRHIHHPERQPILLVMRAHLGILNRTLDQVDAGDVGAGLVGDVLSDHAVAAAQIEHAAVSVDGADLDQVIEMGQVSKAVLA